VWGESTEEFSWRSFRQVGVSGIDAAMDRKSPLMRRVLWSVVLLVCFSLMLAQVYIIWQLFVIYVGKKVYNTEQEDYCFV
jgi:hypothetical protein